ncbi:uncharacterized protein K444DRAFT_526915 [Hyaloscypha bicolor E]|uniref:Major facilitator superfamily (MFS) profile domain-containing protein n=1 Tax=Hyaloscypha bicolor E TaxID=1095630 RepID=A0A2J6TFF1_9HELO|nr:uncharacterized protein K444DRAFT_526915 [Hyaloscypha bicolor E]PMD61761.1 hypothetical protein K444DRAFT_526915 [Hyaloscypha bicolor E]
MLPRFDFANSIGLCPTVYVLTAKPPNIRIRGKMLCIDYFVLHIFSIPITAGLPYPVGTTEANWNAKTAFLLAGLSIIAFIWAFFFFFGLPESKRTTFEKLDILFESEISARKFASSDNFQALI